MIDGISSVHSINDSEQLETIVYKIARLYIQIELEAASRLAERLLIKSNLEEWYHKLFLMMPRTA
jgi:hypothetical protein